MGSQRPTSLRRVGERACVFLFAGAIVNATVAWVCAALIVPDFEGTFRIIVKNDEGTVWQANDRRPPFGSRILWTLRHPTKVKSFWTIVESRGWPALSLCVARDTDKKPTSGIVLPGWPFRNDMKSSGLVPALPLRPIWPGFAINTLFYALLLWLLLLARWTLRRHMRVKRCVCPECAYPTGSSAVCTECGAAVTPNAETLKR